LCRNHSVNATDLVLMKATISLSTDKSSNGGGDNLSMFSGVSGEGW
jgi:hypothetical protein